MKKIVVLLSVFAFLVIGVGVAPADVLDFEDLTGVFNPFPTTNPYHGFDFTGAKSYEKPAAGDDGRFDI